MKLTKLFVLAACLTPMFSFGALVDEMKISDALREKWNDPAVKSRIARGIEENRKGDFSIKFDKTVSDLKAELVRHEFVFGAPTMALAAVQGKDGHEDAERFAKMRKLVWEDLFNGATISTLWKFYEPQPGQYRFEKDAPFMLYRPAPAKMIEMCRELDLTPRMHCLSWFFSQWCFPDWVEKTSEASAAASDRYFKKVCERFGDEVRYWNIANEYCRFYDENTRKYMHRDPVYKAFVEARKHLPESAVFTYNELSECWYDAFYNREYAPTYLIVQNLLLRGCKVDELGMQLHIFSERQWADTLQGRTLSPQVLFTALDVYAGLNIPLQITEITIPGLPEGEVGEANQAFIAENFYRLWFSHPNVKSITWWHTVDGTSKAEGKWKSGILRFDFSKKKVYAVLQKLIKEEWTTKVAAQSDTDKLAFRGFYGKYKITYTLDGKKYEKIIPLYKDGLKAYKLSAEDKQATLSTN